MQHGRIFVGGILGGIVFCVVSGIVNWLVLPGRYELLQEQGHIREAARLPYLPIYILFLLLASIGLVYLYAAARQRLGPGPRTALIVGIWVGLIAGLPGNFIQYAWTYVGGNVSMWWTIEMVAGCTLATLVGGWYYRE